MLAEIITAIIIAVFSAILGGLIQWGRSGTAQALQSRDINDINIKLGELSQKHTQLLENFNKYAPTFRRRVENIESHLKMKDTYETGKYPAFTDARASGEQETVK